MWKTYHWNKQINAFVNEDDGLKHITNCNWKPHHQINNTVTLQEISDLVFDLREKVDESNANTSKLIQIIMDLERYVKAVIRNGIS